MKSKFVFLIIVLIINISCNYGVDFSITNKSDFVIDSITVTNGYHSVKLKNVDIGKKENGFIDFKINNPRNDGNFGIKIYYNNKVKDNYFGYYSNGIPMNSSYDIIIFNDSINIREFRN